MNPDNPMPKGTHETPNLPSARPSGSAFWKVRYACKGGGYHPIWYGEIGGPLIEREHVESAAKAYLRSQKSWLKRIDVIEADEKPNDRGQAQTPRATEADRKDV